MVLHLFVPLLQLHPPLPHLRHLLLELFLRETRTFSRLRQQVSCAKYHQLFSHFSQYIFFIAIYLFVCKHLIRDGGTSLSCSLSLIFLPVHNSVFVLFQRCPARHIGQTTISYLLVSCLGVAQKQNSK